MQRQKLEFQPCRECPLFERSKNFPNVGTCGKDNSKVKSEDLAVVGCGG